MWRLIAALVLCVAVAHAAAPMKISLRKQALSPEHRQHHRNKSALLTTQPANDGTDIPITNFMDAQVMVK